MNSYTLHTRCFPNIRFLIIATEAEALCKDCLKPVDVITTDISHSIRKSSAIAQGAAIYRSQNNKFQLHY